MTNCIVVDRDRKSREAIEQMLVKINGPITVRAYAGIDAAVKACFENKIKMMFINIYDFPVPQKQLILLKKIKEYGTQVIMMSYKIRVARESIAIDAADFIMFPTSTRRLQKASMRALKIIDDFEMPEIKWTAPEEARIAATGS